MAPNEPLSPRSRQIHDWRETRGLVIEGEARVLSRKPGASPAAEPSGPRWGAALERASALAPASPRLARIALPAGLALVALAALALSPSEPERHGALEGSVRVAAAPVIR
ncbi:hypothetical protein [Aureimonas sp. SK2]|uniref:hypothetical protein n=1 Tax=Aureimonas sp. SK2 TaxID=3015992 RepID=UPI0024446DFF|nr:hypothetical protein [Aureimonas sp. SK2]